MDTDDRLDLDVDPAICRALTPTRLTILEAIANGTDSFNELIAVTSLTRTNLSNHLKLLEEAGFVKPDRSKRRPVQTNKRKICLTANKFMLTLL